ncbi:hypothetical protein R1sor_002676 [Riccia sorocarpa]|uniref:Uncharacterized protein n=1 Tax=Riccia sorocarpa TaxID=122646 RepID=A0ABD3H3E9_9MARC
MASHQSDFDAAKDTLGQKTEETKNYGADKTGQAQHHAQGMGEATKQKAVEAKDSTASAGQTAKNKASEATDNAGGMMQQAGDKLKEGWENTKNAVTGNN